MSLDESLGRLTTATILLLLFGLIFYVGRFEGAGFAYSSSRPGRPVVEVWEAPPSPTAPQAPRLLGSPDSAPVILRLTPSTAAMMGRMPVTIEGESFQPGARVLVGTASHEAAYTDSRTLTVKMRSMQVGTYDVSVVNPDGGQATLLNGLRVIDPRQESARRG